MTNTTKRYIVDLCHYIDCIFTLAFMTLLVRCLWYMGDGREYVLGVFIGVLIWPNKKYWAKWLGVEE